MITMDITLLFQMINIIVLMFILNGVLYKPVRQILRDRAEKMKGMQSEVVRFQENARLRQQEVDNKMAKASGRAKAALDSARAEAASAGNAKLASIKAEVEAGKEKMMADIRSQIDTAAQGLQGNLNGFATAMASKILRRSL
ncbi:MAG: ATP synthase F0 subunit B [Desulfocapsaceae bacterium]|nr:ATP synthase F0 subunit B [Desulfocapsaceae bacterium]